MTESKVKENIADALTLSRFIFGLVILSLSFLGKRAYLVVVILGLSGAFTDILDGMAARKWSNNKEENMLGRYDLEIDTFFIMGILGYFSLSQIVIPRFVGLGWIILCFVTSIVYKLSRKVLLFFEIPAICGIIICAGLYRWDLFEKVLMVIAAGVIFNFNRIKHLIMVDFPRSFSKNSNNTEKHLK